MGVAFRFVGLDGMSIACNIIRQNETEDCAIAKHVVQGAGSDIFCRRVAMVERGPPSPPVRPGSPLLLMAMAVPRERADSEVHRR